MTYVTGWVVVVAVAKMIQGCGKYEILLAGIYVNAS